MPSINDLDTILSGAATSKTPSLITNTSKSFTPSINDIDRILKSTPATLPNQPQQQKTGGSLPSIKNIDSILNNQPIQPQRTQEQVQQMIQQGVKEPEQRIVPGQKVELPEGTGFLKRALVGVGNFLFQSSPDILARDIQSGATERLKTSIIESAQKDINSLTLRLEDARESGDMERATRLEKTLVDTIESANTNLGSDIFQKPTALQTAGALATAGAAIASPLIPFRLATTPLVKGTRFIPGQGIVPFSERALGGLGRASVEAGLAGAGTTAAFMGGEKLSETGSLEDAAISALVGLPTGFALGAALPPVGKALGVFGSKVVSPTIEKINKVTGGKLGSKLSHVVVRGLIKPLTTTLDNIGLEDVSKTLKNNFEIRRGLAGKAQLNKDTALKILQDFLDDVNGDEAKQLDIRKSWAKGEFIMGQNSHAPDAKLQSLDERLKHPDVVNDPVAQASIKHGFETTNVVDSVKAKYGPIYKDRTPLPFEEGVEATGKVVIPEGMTVLNDVEDELASYGYSRLEMRKLVDDLGKEIGIKKGTTPIEFSDAQKLQASLDRELPKYKKLSETEVSSTEVSPKTKPKSKPSLLVTEEKLATEKPITKEVRKPERIKRQAQQAVPRLITPRGVSSVDEAHNNLIKYIIENDPEISVLPTANERKRAAEKLIFNETSRNIDSFATRGIASAREFDFKTLEEAIDAGWIPDYRKTNKEFIKDQGDLYDSMIDQNLDDAAKFESILKTVEIDEETGLPVDPSERLKKYISDIVEKVQVETNIKTGSIKEGRNSADFVREKLDDILGTGPSDDPSSYRRALAAVKQFNAAKLTTSIVANIFQPLNSLLVGDLPSFHQGFKSMLHITQSPIKKYTAQEFGTLAGAKAGSVIEPTNLFKTITEQTAWKKFIDKLVKPFKWSEINLNRTHAANTGAFWGIRQFEKKNFKEVSRYLGSDDLTAAIERGFLNEEDLTKIGGNFMDYTQFGFNPLELPTAFNDEFGSVILQFKSFGYRQMKLIINEVSRGDKRALRQIAILTMIYPPLGQAQEVMKRIVTGKALEEGLTEEDQSWLGWYIDGALNTGIFAIIGDAIAQGSYNRGVQAIVGPTGSAIGGAIDVVGKGVADPDIARTADDIAKLTTSQFGGGGRGIYNLGKWLWEQ